MSSFIKDIISRIPGARDEEFGNGNLSPLGLLIFLALYTVVFLTVGVYLWNNAAVPLIPALNKTGKNGEMKLLGLGILTALYIH
tara:strand:+ start:164 stop:415 length:252 start_codon:yes stop_codon:yes gene_type:complete